MARTDQSELGLGGPGLASAPRPVRRRRVSTGHVVMIVAGLLATVLTYAVLRQAAAPGTEETVAAADIHAGQTADPSLFATTNVKAPASSLSGILTPGDVAGVRGQVAVAEIKKGQLVARQQFRPSTPPEPSMAIAVDPQTIPGGTAALVPGAKIDLVAATQAGAPFMVAGLAVLRTQVPSTASLGAPTTVRIDVAVPDAATAQQILAATNGGKFTIRVTGAPGSG